MSEKAARQLLPMTIVQWQNDPNDLGTVISLNFGSFFITWANGQRGWIAYDHAQKISKN